LLVDCSQERFYPWFSDVVDLDFYTAQVHRQCINLVNRNPANLRILEQAVRTLQIDFTGLLGDYLELLQDLLLDEKFGDSAIGILTAILKKSESPAQSALDLIKNKIVKTFNEKQRVKLL